MTNRSTLLLDHHLRELKLPTFLREYRKLADLCAAAGADHPDYLLRLSELELIDTGTHRHWNSSTATSAWRSVASNRHASRQ